MASLFRDKLCVELKPGDLVAYATLDYRRAALKLGRVERVTDTCAFVRAPGAKSVGRITDSSRVLVVPGSLTDDVLYAT